MQPTRKQAVAPPYTKQAQQITVSQSIRVGSHLPWLPLLKLRNFNNNYSKTTTTAKRPTTTATIERTYALTHEAGDDAVEFAALVAVAGGAGAELPEVFARLGRRRPVQAQLDPARRGPVNAHVEVDRVRHVGVPLAEEALEKGADHKPHPQCPRRCWCWCRNSRRSVSGRRRRPGGHQCRRRCRRRWYRRSKGARRTHKGDSQHGHLEEWALHGGKNRKGGGWGMGWNRNNYFLPDADQLISFLRVIQAVKKIGVSQLLQRRRGHEE